MLISLQITMSLNENRKKKKITIVSLEQKLLEL